MLALMSPGIAAIANQLGGKKPKLVRFFICNLMFFFVKFWAGKFLLIPLKKSSSQSRSARNGAAAVKSK